MNAHLGSLRFVGARLSAAIRPQPPVPFRTWLTQNIILIDGEKKGELWSAHNAPYLLDIADCLSQEHPCNLVTVRKCQQSGVSILALAWSLYIAENVPDNILYAVPGIDALQDMNSQKLQPLIDAWSKETGKKIIIPVTSRSGAGSTTYEKRFPGGYLSLANANSVMDLSSKTCRYGVKDEVSKWQETPKGDDPEALFFGRFTAFRRQKSFKIFELSTPEVDSGHELGEGAGHCRIDRSFRRSDQRFWNVQCPECTHEFVQTEDGLLIDKRHPHKTVFICPNCTHHISEIERVAAVRAGRFIATQQEPDRHPGFHIDAFMSLMMSYEAIAEDNIAAEAKGEPGIKNYTNLVLALPYAMKGNAPDHQRLMERREKYSQYVIPEEGLIFVVGADVQHDGIFVEAVAFAEDRQTWSIDAQFLAGSTDDINAGAWLLLDQYYRTEFADVHGLLRRIEAMAVDAGDGARTTQVYEWCRQRPNTYAIKGQHGRGVPAISLPQKRSITKKGKRKRFGSALSWPVGTWSLKAEFYGNLHKMGLAAGLANDPPGYCHFGDWLGEEYFLQITAEYFDQKMVNGRLREEWKPVRRNNHFLDCRIYAMAMAEHLGLSRLTPDGWAKLRASLWPASIPDLLSTASEKIIAEALPEPPVPEKPKPNINAKRKAWGNR